MDYIRQDKNTLRLEIYRSDIIRKQTFGSPVLLIILILRSDCFLVEDKVSLVRFGRVGLRLVVPALDTRADLALERALAG